MPLEYHCEYCNIYRIYRDGQEKYYAVEKHLKTKKHIRNKENKMKLSDISPNKQVVMNENTLGYLIPGTNQMGVHAGSVIRGGHLHKNGPVQISPSDKIRRATPDDFENYRVDMKGFFEPKVIEVYNREKLISKIEAITGALKSVPWNKVSTEDLKSIYFAMRRD